MKRIPPPGPLTHAWEAWAFDRAQRSLNRTTSVSTAYAHADAVAYLREQAAKYQVLAEKEQQRVGDWPTAVTQDMP